MNHSSSNGLFGNKYFRIFGVLLLLAIVGFVGLNIMIGRKYTPNNAKTLKTAFGEVLYDENLVSEDSIEAIISYATLAYKLADQYLSLEKETDLTTIYLFSQRGISTTFPLKKTIIYYYFDQIKPPIIHEYIHSRLGIFKEYWFTEGFATYLSLKLKAEHPELLKYKDVNDNWFKNKKEGQRVLSNIDDLTAKYSRKELEKRFNIEEDKRNFSDLASKIEFYRLSSSFCEFLAQKVKFENIARLAIERTWWNNSIEKMLRKENHNTMQYYKEWLDGLYR